MQKCLKCFGTLGNANGEAIYNVGEKVIISSKILKTFFEYKVLYKLICQACGVVLYELEITRKSVSVPNYILCPEERIERTRKQ